MPADAPPEVQPFYENFSPYGSWWRVPSCRWVWQPTVVTVDTGWTPYSQGGRWGLVGLGLVLVVGVFVGLGSFHYGRWGTYPGSGLVLGCGYRLGQGLGHVAESAVRTWVGPPCRPPAATGPAWALTWYGSSVSVGFRVRPVPQLLHVRVVRQFLSAQRVSPRDPGRATPRDRLQQLDGGEQRHQREQQHHHQRGCRLPDGRHEGSRGRRSRKPRSSRSRKRRTDRSASIAWNVRRTGWSCIGPPPWLNPAENRRHYGRKRAPVRRAPVQRFRRLPPGASPASRRVPATTRGSWRRRRRSRSNSMVRAAPRRPTRWLVPMRRRPAPRRFLPGRPPSRGRPRRRITDQRFPRPRGEPRLAAPGPRGRDLPLIIPARWPRRRPGPCWVRPARTTPVPLSDPLRATCRGRRRRRPARSPPTRPPRPRRIADTACTPQPPPPPPPRRPYTRQAVPRSAVPQAAPKVNFSRPPAATYSPTPSGRVPDVDAVSDIASLLLAAVSSIASFVLGALAEIPGRAERSAAVVFGALTRHAGACLSQRPKRPAVERPVVGTRAVPSQPFRIHPAGAGPAERADGKGRAPARMGEPMIVDQAMWDSRGMRWGVGMLGWLLVGVMSAGAAAPVAV